MLENQMVHMEVLYYKSKCEKIEFICRATDAII